MEESAAVNEKQAATSPSRKNSKTSPSKSNDGKYAAIHRRVSVTERRSEEDLLRLASPSSSSSSSSSSQKHRRSSSDTSALHQQTPYTRTQSSRTNKSASPPSSNASGVLKSPLAPIDVDEMDIHAIAAENGMKLESEAEVAIFKKAIATALSSPDSRLRESMHSPSSCSASASANQTAEEPPRFDSSKPPSFGPESDAIFTTAADPSPSQSSGFTQSPPAPATPKAARDSKRSSSSSSYSAPVLSKRSRQRSPDLKKNDNSAVLSLAPSTINTVPTAQSNNDSQDTATAPATAPALSSPSNQNIVLLEASECPVTSPVKIATGQNGGDEPVSTVSTTQEEVSSALPVPSSEPESAAESTAESTAELDRISSSSPSPPPLKDVYMAVADVTADHLQQLAFELRTTYRKDSFDKGKNPSSSESTRAQSPQLNQPSGTSERKLSDLSDTSALMRQLEELERTNSPSKSQADPRQRFKRKEMELVLQVLIGLINRYGEESVQLALTQVLGSEGTITPENIVDLAMNIRPELAKLEPLPIFQAFEDELDCYGSDIDGDEMESDNPEKEEDSHIATLAALADHIDSTEHVLPASFSSPDHKSSVYFRRIDDLEMNHIDPEVDSETADARKDLATTLGLNRCIDFPVINGGQGPSVLHHALQESRNTLWFKQQVERLSRVPPLVRMNLMPVEHLLKSGLKCAEVQWHISLRPSNNTATTRIERELKQKQAAAANHVNVISFDAYQRAPGPVKTANTAGGEPDVEPIQKPVRSTPSSAAHSRNPSNTDSVVIHDDVENESFLNKSTTSTHSRMSSSSRRSAKSPKIEPLPSSTEHWVDWRKVKADLVAARAEKSTKQKEDKTSSRKQTTVAARRLSVGVSAETMWKYEAQIGKNGRRSAAPKASKV
eukprot:GILJ01000762.1.p1 GENE.GILJ01000762.1~~GILJ01000762.1.p1  ORF type:complete len:899 (+),score=189.11 GILJ01000762.1:39-2735(+)